MRSLSNLIITNRRWEVRQDMLTISLRIPCGVICRMNKNRRSRLVALLICGNFLMICSFVFCFLHSHSQTRHSLAEHGLLNNCAQSMQ
mgnify:CR=1 FL=1